MKVAHGKFVQNYLRKQVMIACKTIDYSVSSDKPIVYKQRYFMHHAS